MSEYLIQGSTLDNIANAINAKTGGTSAMTPAQMVTAIGSISGGGTDLSMVEVYVADYLDAESATVTTGVLDRYRRQIYGYGTNAP